MRRHQLIQLAILIVAMICGYKLIESLIAIIVTAFFQPSYFSSESDILLPYLVVVIIYTIVLVVLIRFNRQLADYIDKQGNPGAVRSEETLSLRVDQTNLLFIVLVALSLITLIDVLPNILMSVYRYFKNEIGHPGGQIDLDFKTAAIKLVFALIILLTAKRISAWLSRQSPANEPLIETTNEP